MAKPLPEIPPGQLDCQPTKRAFRLTVRAFDFGMTKKKCCARSLRESFGGFPGVRCRRSQRTGAKLVALVVECSVANTDHIHQSHAAT
jgi:hypothetical protein